MIISGNKFRQLADIAIDEETHVWSLESRPKTIFLFTHWTDHFAEHSLTKINWPFTLITHNADTPAGDLRILEHPYLNKWYGMNCQIEHPKLVPIPIGIANGRWPHGDEEALKRVMYADIPKKGFCYCNFSQRTHSDRRGIHQMLQKYPWIDFEDNVLSFEEYLRKLKSYRMVISPRGNSVDCHRVWESIYVGTVPIVVNHVAMKTFSEKLPIISVDGWDDLRLDELLELCDALKNRPPSFLHDFEYWKQQIVC